MLLTLIKMYAQTHGFWRKQTLSSWCSFSANAPVRWKRRHPQSLSPTEPTTSICNGEVVSVGRLWRSSLEGWELNGKQGLRKVASAWGEQRKGAAAMWGVLSEGEWSGPFTTTSRCEWGMKGRWGRNAPINLRFLWETRCDNNNPCWVRLFPSLSPSWAPSPSLSLGQGWEDKGVHGATFP